MNASIILAAGKGSRFNNKTPKQFIKINNKEILSYSVNTFYNHPNIDEVVIVTSKDWIDHVKNKYPHCITIIGGDKRKDSTLNGLYAVSNCIDNVLIHDAARPLISKEIISNCINELKNNDASVPILNSPDSLIKIIDNTYQYIKRDYIKIVQTPQCFKLDLIKKVFVNNLSKTDEIGMLLKIYPNKKIKYVNGSIKNRKITTIEDLNIIKALI